MDARERFSVNLSPKTHAVIRVLSELTGMPKSKLVRTIMDGALPALEQSVKALKQAKAQDTKAINTLQEALSSQRENLDLLDEDLRKMQKGYQSDIED